MIMINCCATCKYNKDGICMNRDSYSTEVKPDESCDEWKELDR